jgi:hypothetical protein
MTEARNTYTCQDFATTRPANPLFCGILRPDTRHLVASTCVLSAFALELFRLWSLKHGINTACLFFFFYIIMGFCKSEFGSVCLINELNFVKCRPLSKFHGFHIFFLFSPAVKEDSFVTRHQIEFHI